MTDQSVSLSRDRHALHKWPPKTVLRWPVLRILSSAILFSLFDLLLLVVDPGNTQLRAGHGEVAIFNFNTRLLFAVSCPPSRHSLIEPVRHMRDYVSVVSRS